MVDLEFDELKREFLAEASEKVREMQAKVDEGSAEARERLMYLAHQLKGSGGSYGFQRISDDAAELEKTLEKLAAGAADAAEARIQQFVLNLRDEVDRRSRELAPAAS
jgi:chemotaxis protein histidine kinase CheA